MLTHSCHTLLFCLSSSIYLSPTFLFPHSLIVMLSFKIISCNFTFHTPFLHFQNVFISCTAISTHTTPSYPSLFCNLYLCNFIYIAHTHTWGQSPRFGHEYVFSPPGEEATSVCGYLYLGVYTISVLVCVGARQDRAPRREGEMFIV